MDIKYLNIQQYIDKHPLLLESMDMRSSYMAYLKLLILSAGRLSDWEDQVIALYEKNLLFNTKTVSYDISELAEEAEKKSVFKFRYLLLTDALFIKSFFNKTKLSKDILQSTIGLFNKKYRNNFRKLFEVFYSDGNILFPKAFRQLSEVYQIIWSNRRFISQREKKVMITANMSAGKSTLLNALSGKKINKTQNDSCTAKIHFLYNKAGEDGLNYEWDYDFEIDASLEILMDDNENNKNQEIYVGTRFRSLTDINNRICYIDTPGVNSSMDKEHRLIANSFIKNTKCDLLLYLFNGENIGSNDDIRHLKYVKDNYIGRIIFLVNRLDRYKKDTDSVPDTLNSVKNDLQKLGFQEPEVYPISAYAAYLSKICKYGNTLSDDEQDDIDFLKRKLQREGFKYEQYYPVVVEGIDETDELDNLLLHSGVLSLEKIIYQ